MFIFGEMNGKHQYAAGCPENHIDVAVSTHSEALSWQGYGTHKVWILEEAE